LSGLGKFIEKRYIDRLFDEISGSDRSGIHVTDLVSPCLRQIFYNLKMKEMSNGQERDLTLEQAHTFWLGHKYHSIIVSNVAINENGWFVIPDLRDVRIEKGEDDKYYVFDKNDMMLGVLGYELPIEHYGIKGQIDEIIEYNGEVAIVDKKSTSYIPSQPYGNHVRQVEMYSVLFWREYGIVPKYGSVLYILKQHEKDKDGKKKFKVKAYVWELRPLEEIEKEMLDRLEKIKTALEKNELPPATPNALCKWCLWKDLCRDNLAEIKVKRQIKLDFWW